MSQDDALADLQARVRNYEARYEPVDDDSTSYIKIFNLSSKLLVNHVYGSLAKVVVPALMAWNTGSQPIYLCRAGETAQMQRYMIQQQKSDKKEPADVDSIGNKPNISKRMRSDRLGERGLLFRDALCDFVEKEGIAYMKKKNPKVMHATKADTGTSISGLRQRHDPLSFPCLVMSKELEREPFHTRFPGGESYGDLINRLESVVIDMEQQLGPTVVVTHVSVLQVLVSYFRSTPVGKCTEIEIPMHTVLKFVPLRGGGWLESHHKLSPEKTEVRLEKQPIWGDSRSCLPQKRNQGEVTESSIRL